MYAILKLLKKFELSAILFLTGHVAEKIAFFPKILDLLQNHEIGYHSTCHSVRPNLFEYTDLENYHDAYVASLERETAHINPLSGEIEGRGGIEVLKDLFPQKSIEAFRAPGFSWSPPHLEALADLGIKYDFSTNLSRTPIHYKGITFFPLPILIDWGKDIPNYYRHLLHSIWTEKTTVLDFHPNLIVNQRYWDLFLPESAPQKTTMQMKYSLLKFKILFRTIKFLRMTKSIETIPRLEKSRVELEASKINVDTVFKMIISWPISQFKYKPVFLRSHLLKFFSFSGHSQ